MRGPGKLLLVDDEPRVLSSLRRTLRREGFEIFTAESGSKGLALLEEQDVDVIVSDHKMPRMDGLQFLGRAAQLRPRAARLILTGWNGAVTERDLARLGIYALLPKPWDDGELKAVLKSAYAASAAAIPSRLAGLRARIAGARAS